MSATMTPKPCPFCGSTNGYVERESICVYQFNCGCGAKGPPVEKLKYQFGEGAPESDALRAWNKRPRASNLLERG